MAKKLSEHLNINEKDLQVAGVFDPILSVDSKFFIDPKSLQTTQAPEFVDARKKLSLRYAQIFKLLASSKVVGDNFWKAAYKHFPKGEVQEICIGYGFDNTGGRGIGPKLVTETMKTIQEFIHAGLDDPVLFELVGLFQKNIGSDIVSDMIARVLQDDIISYTTRITEQLSKSTTVKPRKYKYKEHDELAFYNQYNKKLVFLLPADVLQPLPVAEDWESVDKVCAQNRAVRNQFAKMIGAYNWKTAHREVNKALLKDAMLAHPEAMQDLLRQYRSKPAKSPYDFKGDPSGEYNWYEEATKFTKAHPLQLPSVTTVTEVDKVVQKIINKFHDFIENNAGWTCLYQRGQNGKVLHESYAQKLFFGIADAYCDANNLDISPETNSGRGPVDFKFSNGRKAKVLVEIKLTSNPQLVHGFEKQVGEYEKAEKPYQSYYLVLEVTDPKSHQDKLNTAIADILDKKKRTPIVHYVNARRQKPASKA